jgi:predicted adenine nucleotide alpha hydrolase (AANH) superfamily ATPase
MRLERSAIEAKKNGFDFYTTTLAISPHKVQEKLKNFGKLFESKYGIPYLARNFVKQDGFKNSVEYTKQYQIFRQDYCGCFYSLWEGGPEAQKKAAEWGYLPPKQV